MPGKDKKKKGKGKKRKATESVEEENDEGKEIYPLKASCIICLRTYPLNRSETDINQ